MTRDLTICETDCKDVADLLALYPLMFPAEDLRPLVEALLRGPLGVLSLAALKGEVAVAHALFSPCGIAATDQSGALLGPLGVSPQHQGRGLGRALIETGLAQLRERGVGWVFVLGDPAFYGRFGFLPERQVSTPQPIPDDWSEAWQSLRLAAGRAAPTGPLSVPAPWMEPTLWRP